MVRPIARVRWLRDLTGVAVYSPKALAELIDDMSASARDQGPLAMNIERADGDCLLLGVSDDGAVLSWQGASGDPPYLVSVGDGAPGREINFYDGEEGPWLDSGNLVPVDLAQSVALAFVEGRELSAEVRWQEI